MAVKIQISLDKKMEHDLLIEALREYKTAQMVAWKAIENPVEKTGIREKIGNLTDLIAKLT